MMVSLFAFAAMLLQQPEQELPPSLGSVVSMDCHLPKPGRRISGPADFDHFAVLLPGGFQTSDLSAAEIIDPSDVIGGRVVSAVHPVADRISVWFTAPNEEMMIVTVTNANGDGPTGPNAAVGLSSGQPRVGLCLFLNGADAASRFAYWRNNPEHIGEAP